MFIFQVNHIYHKLIFRSSLHIYMCVCVCVCVYIYIYIYVCVYMCMYIYTYACYHYVLSLCKMYYLHFVFKNNYHCNLFMLNHGGKFIYKLFSFFHSPFQHSMYFYFHIYCNTCTYM